ncbi:hypothetical protein BGZ96_002840 [Linnemannia gamsii]|uniref:RecA family profile 1 domain-containing protein n=1 Tax=Linnemannia gamsii TaxID=64522 RepID=A0ABQ7K7K5_9FUNG|nr:hypothetical protein BGZ96_002840 [Linnemannia gamsii]
MNRLGYRPELYQVAWQRARDCTNIGQITLMTHFSDADTSRGIEHQMQAFERGAKELTGSRCLANSAAVLWHGRTHADWVRPGILLYGASPSGVAAALTGYGFLPAMTLTSEIVAVQNLVPGDTVGYGSTYTAEKPMRIGVVACGYADGYPHAAPSGTPVIVDGVRTQLVGRVSMDMITVDLTSLPNAGIGSNVQLWAPASHRYQALAKTAPVQKLAAIEAADVPRFSSGIQEFDRVLGGGLVAGGVVLIGGDPGIGKSTLLLQSLAVLARERRALYVSGEESSAQIALRAQRLGLMDSTAPASELHLLAEIQLEKIQAAITAERPAVAVIDSIQTVYSEALSSAPGSVAQVRECAAQLTRLAKQMGVTIIMVGHVTKEGSLAGPRGWRAKSAPAHAGKSA